MRVRRQVEFSADGSKLSVAGTADDGRITWDLATGKEVARMSGAEAAAAGYGATGGIFYSEPRARPARSPDGKRVVRPIPGDKPDSLAGVAVVDAGTGKELCRLEDINAGPEMHFSADGALIFIGSLGGAGQGATVYDAVTGKKKHVLKPSATLQNNIFLGQGMIAPCPDGVHVAIVDGNQWGNGIDGPHAFTCGVYDARLGKEVRRFNGAGLLYKLTWGADGTTLVGSGMNSLKNNDAGFLFVADRRTGRVVKGPFPTGSGAVAVAVAPDGQSIATGAPDGVRVWEAATGGVRYRLAGGSFAAASLTFSPDGRWLAAAGGDQAAVVWDLRKHWAAGRPADMEVAWRELAVGDAKMAHRAARGLTATPGAAAFLRGKLAPVSPPDPAKVAKLIADLDAPGFADREAAQKELAKLGEVAQPAVERAKAESPSEEVRARAAAVLKAPLTPTADRLRATRAVEAVGWMKSAEARELLAAWAGGAEGAWLTRAAKQFQGK